MLRRRGAWWVLFFYEGVWRWLLSGFWLAVGGGNGFCCGCLRVNFLPFIYMRFLLSWVLVFGVAGAAAVSASGAADLIIVNANVRTLEEGEPRAEAVAVAGNRILEVGGNEEVRRLAGPETRVIDAGGRLLLPGFNDAHVHMDMGGYELSNLDLRDADSPEEFAERIRRHAEKLPAGRWILGMSWDHERWEGAPLPRKEWIDEYTRENPVALKRLDGHMLLANSLALEIAGITKETPDPDGGTIVRDAETGEPTGVLRESAQGLLSRYIPEKSFEERLEGLRAASEHAARLGVTSVQDMSGGGQLAVYQELLRRGELKTRVYAVSPVRSWERLAAVQVQAAFGSDMLRIGGIKGFVDGSLGSTTAIFYEPYLDEPDTRGLFNDDMFPEGIMLERLLRADRAGIQLMVHAIGDRGNDVILELFGKVRAENGGERERRFRVEHAQHLTEGSIRRFAEDGVIASMQPYHAIDDGRWAEKRIGPERAETTYAFRDLIDAGARLAFGTDWPVAPLDPMPTVFAAVTRRTLDGANPEGWVPEQKISVEEAVRAYTVGSAFAEFAEGEKGTIARGKLADFVLWSEDIFAIDPVEIEGVRAVLTVVDGRVVWEDGEEF